MRKNKISISITGVLFLLFLFYYSILSFRKEYKASIVIKKPKFEVFHTFFTEKNLSSWFPDAQRVSISGGLRVGSILSFEFKDKKIEYEIIEFEELVRVKWKNFESYQEFVFTENALGTIVDYRFYMEGLVGFVFDVIRRDDIQRNVDNILYLLKKNVEI